MRIWIKTIVNKFAISNHTALISGVHALRSYLKLICEYELHCLPSKKVSDAKDHGKNYINVRPPLVRHLLRNRLSERGDDFWASCKYSRLCRNFMLEYWTFRVLAKTTKQQIKCALTLVRTIILVEIIWFVTSIWVCYLIGINFRGYLFSR